MSDSTTDVPSGSSSSSPIPDPNSNGADTASTTFPDPNTGSEADSTNSDPTDPSNPDPGSSSQPDPNAGATTDPNSGTTTQSVPQDGSNTGSPDGSVPDDGLNNPVPPATPTTSLPVPFILASAAQPSPTVNPTSNANALPDTGTSGDKTTDNSPPSLGGQSDSHTKTIIIASSVSGGVTIILVLLVLVFVFRRRRNNKRRTTAFVDAIPNPNRRDSDATWIGPKAGVSFDESKLEAGTGARTSVTSLGSNTTTLADFARTKSSAFSTPSHTPKPSLDTINTTMAPMAPMVPANPVLAPRRRKSGVPAIRINSDSTLQSAVTTEVPQAEAMGPQSPGSPNLPLMTPISPPLMWRNNQAEEMEYMRAPALRDSMVSLSRQSSKASSRNSFMLDEPDLVRRPSKFAAIAKKRRSRGDSIDPFRKSSAVAAARRKSRAESVARQQIANQQRKSRAETIAPPTTPGGRRKSRAGSVAPPMTPRRRSPSQTSRVVGSPTSTVFAPPDDFVGLPRTPRTPTAIAARRSRAAAEMPRRLPSTRSQSVPRSTRAPAPAPREPRTPGAERPPRTPVTAREPRTPGGHPRRAVSVPRTPTSLEDAVRGSEMSVPTTPAERLPRPLPKVPTSATRAELRLSGLTRTLSEMASSGRHGQTPF